MRPIDADELMSQAFTTKQGYDAVLVEDIVDAPTITKESIIKAFFVGIVEICNKQELCADCKLVHRCPIFKDSFEYFPVLEYVHECLQMIGDTNDEALDNSAKAGRELAEKLDKHGHWITDDSKIYLKHKCSECGHEVILKYPYCENCGAEMDGNTNDET